MLRRPPAYSVRKTRQESQYALPAKYCYSGLLPSSQRQTRNSNYISPNLLALAAGSSRLSRSRLHLFRADEIRARRVGVELFVASAVTVRRGANVNHSQSGDVSSSQKSQIPRRHQERFDFSSSRVDDGPGAAPVSGLASLALLVPVLLWAMLRILQRLDILSPLRVGTPPERPSELF